MTRSHSCAARKAKGPVAAAARLIRNPVSSPPAIASMVCRARRGPRVEGGQRDEDCDVPATMVEPCRRHAPRHMTLTGNCDNTERSESARPLLQTGWTEVPTEAPTSITTPEQGGFLRICQLFSSHTATRCQVWAHTRPARAVEGSALRAEAALGLNIVVDRIVAAFICTKCRLRRPLCAQGDT